MRSNDLRCSRYVPERLNQELRSHGCPPRTTTSGNNGLDRFVIEPRDRREGHWRFTSAIGYHPWLRTSRIRTTRAPRESRASSTTADVAFAGTLARSASGLLGT